MNYLIKKYTAEDRQSWDEFVAGSVNGTFLLMRDYMEYHADRFTDHSLMFYSEAGKLCSILPANIVVDEDGQKHLHSHQGLTYGGFVLSEKEGTNDVMQLFTDLKEYMKQQGINYLHYKQIPTIYHQIPAQEDEYALWRNNAQLEVCNISTTLYLAHRPKMAKVRHWGYTSARKRGLYIDDDTSLDAYWPILEEGLKERYNALPVHTLAEIKKLKELFPDNIRCITVSKSDGEMLGGVVIYVCRRCVHLQYSIVTRTGMKMRALDLLYMEIIDHLTKGADTDWFDFGTSNEDRGRYLNSNLISFKESFGGRGVAYKQWLLEV